MLLQLIYEAPHTPSLCVHNVQHWLFFKIYSTGVVQERERNDQIGRAAVVRLFVRISVALSVILLYLICVLKEKGDRQGAQGQEEGGIKRGDGDGK